MGKKHQPIAHRMIVSFSYPVYNKARETIFEQNLRGKFKQNSLTWGFNDNTLKERKRNVRKSMQMLFFIKSYYGFLRALIDFKDFVTKFSLNFPRNYFFLLLERIVQVHSYFLLMGRENSPKNVWESRSS